MDGGGWRAGWSINSFSLELISCDIPLISSFFLFCPDWIPFFGTSETVDIHYLFFSLFPWFLWNLSLTISPWDTWPTISPISWQILYIKSFPAYLAFLYTFLQYFYIFSYFSCHLSINRTTIYSRIQKRILLSIVICQCYSIIFTNTYSIKRISCSPFFLWHDFLSFPFIFVPITWPVTSNFYSWQCSLFLLSWPFPFSDQILSFTWITWPSSCDTALFLTLFLSPFLTCDKQMLLLNHVPFFCSPCDMNSDLNYLTLSLSLFWPVTLLPFFYTWPFPFPLVTWITPLSCDLILAPFPFSALWHPFSLSFPFFDLWHCICELFLTIYPELHTNNCDTPFLSQPFFLTKPLS